MRGLFQKKYFTKALTFLIILSSLNIYPFIVSANEKISAYQLNFKLLSFSDNYQESISEAVDKIIADGVDTTARALYQTIKVFYVSSAIDIATESNAVQQLMDMMVMLRLQRMVWEDGGHALSKPGHAKLIAEQLQKLEKGLYSIAAEVFLKEDIDRIVSLAEKWKRENPNREYIAFVRFQDFSNSEEKAQLEETIKKGGLFSTISDANREIEEARFAIERAMFIANHMPIMLEWQAELFLYKVLSTGDIRDLLNQSERLTLTTEQMSMQFENLPANIQALFDKNAKSIESITNNMAITSDNLKLVSDQLSPLFLEKGSDGESTININQVESIFKDALATSQELIRLTERLDQFAYDEQSANHLASLITSQLIQANSLIEQQISKTDERVEQQTQKIFIMALILILVFFLCYVLARRHLINYAASNDVTNA